MVENEKKIFQALVWNCCCSFFRMEKTVDAYRVKTIIRMSDDDNTPTQEKIAFPSHFLSPTKSKVSIGHGEKLKENWVRYCRITFILLFIRNTIDPNNWDAVEEMAKLLIVIFRLEGGLVFEQRKHHDAFRPNFKDSWDGFHKNICRNNTQINTKQRSGQPHEMLIFENKKLRSSELWRNFATKFGFSGRKSLFICMKIIERCQMARTFLLTSWERYSLCGKKMMEFVKCDVFSEDRIVSKRLKNFKCFF